MRRMQLLVAVMVVLSLLPVLMYGQNLVRVAPYTVTSQYLNNQIVGDTLSNGARRDSNAIYVLQRGGIYLSNAVITNGWPLRIQTHDTTAGVSYPIVYLYPSGTANNPPGTFVTMRANFSMKKVILSGYFEPGNYVAKDTSYLNHLQGALFNTGVAGLNLTLDSCILTNTNGNHVRTDQPPKTLKITNCTFGNMGFLGRSNLGAGKAIDVRAGSVDSLIVLNSTFVNSQDRIIRHYSSTAAIKYLRFEHNTCVNGMGYHGFLSLGMMGKRAIISNNLLFDSFALGADTDAVRQAEFNDSGEKDAFGFSRMTWIMSVPNDSTQWIIKNNYYVITPAGKAFFDSASVWPIVANPKLTEGSPLTYNISKRIGADSTTAFTKVTTTLTKIPSLMTTMMKWYRWPKAAPYLGSGKTKETGNWLPQFDFDRRSIEYYRDTLNCAYSTSDAIYTGAEGAFPVGDLRWFPTRYSSWLSSAVSAVENQVNGVPLTYTLEQNYPNPFNPATKVSFSLPKAGFVTLTVFNVLGQKVATLLSENRAAGTHEVQFDASPLTSGMYFYRLDADNFSAVKKMMLLK
jgi:hypothetical protein